MSGGTAARGGCIAMGKGSETQPLAISSSAVMKQKCNRLTMVAGIFNQPVS